jgi:hypothetical protein
MGNNGKASDETVRKIGNHDFKIVKQGLDVDEVENFVNDLLGEVKTLRKERDELQEKENHIVARTKLAERMVIEAEKVSEEAREEAIAAGKSEADRIVRDSHNEITRIKVELASRIDEIKEQINDIKEQVESLDGDMPDSLPIREEQPVSVTGTESSKIQEESSEIEKTDEEQPSLIESIADMAVEVNEEGRPLQKGEIELEFLPPIDVMKIVEIMNKLEALPDIEVSELIPRNERPSILMVDKGNSDLLKILVSIPEIREVKETKSDGNGRKLEINLAGDKVVWD